MSLLLLRVLAVNLYLSAMSGCFFFIITQLHTNLHGENSQAKGTFK